jgi:hypothetical protein
MFDASPRQKVQNDSKVRTANCRKAATWAARPNARVRELAYLLLPVF